MVTLVTGGVFDVLHSNHRSFISNLIDLSNAKSVIILLSTDERTAFLKSNNRPLFSYLWRQQDLAKFFKDIHPNLKLRFKALKKGTSESDAVSLYKNDPDYIIGLKDKYSWLSGHINNLITVSEQAGHHTSDIEYSINNGKATSDCESNMASAVRVREGKIMTIGTNGSLLSKVTKVGIAGSCRKCKPGRCNYLNEVEVALADAKSGDDLFLSHKPNLGAATLIKEKKINRVVYFQDMGNNDGVDYLMSNKVKIKKAGI